jgi:hypothetical protein
MNAPWLFAEAYKYRRLHECFSISKYWRDYGTLAADRSVSPVKVLTYFLCPHHKMCSSDKRFGQTKPEDLCLFDFESCSFLFTRPFSARRSPALGRPCLSCRLALPTYSSIAKG